MSAPTPLCHAVERLLVDATRHERVRITSIRRLALLVTGMIASQASTLLVLSRKLESLGATNATSPESINRRLGRILADRKLSARRLYVPLLARLIPWQELCRPGHRVVLIVDDSSKRDRIHLLRISLAYRGTAIPLAWEVWAQNVPLPAHRYWLILAACLSRVATIVPATAEVVVVADRAFDTPRFIEVVAAHGWHWIMRTRANGAMRVRLHGGRECSIADLRRTHVPTAGRRFKLRGHVFKAAGWCQASIIGLWGQQQREPLVVLTDLPTRWEVLTWYDRRFWIESSFRTDKGAGWRWEHCQVTLVSHHRRLVLAMALATVCTLLLGGLQAEENRQHALTRRATRPRGKPRHATFSLFTLGLERADHWLYQRRRGRFPRRLLRPAAPSWTMEWRALTSHLFLSQTVLA